MQEKELEEIRTSANKRDDYLLYLAKTNKQKITYITKKMITYKYKAELVQNECTQYFLLGCNRGIDQVRINDDGRGKNNPEKYIIWVGCNNLKDFLRREYLQKRKLHTYYLSKEIKEEIPDPVDYAEHIISNYYISEYINSLQEIDKKILYLILEGQYQEEILSNIHNTNIIKNVAHTLGVSNSLIYYRLKVLRSVFTLLPNKEL